MSEPWHTKVECKVDGCHGPVVLHIEIRGAFMCAACGADQQLTRAEVAEVLRAERAWEVEQDRQLRDARLRREHGRKARLLDEAVARRRACKRAGGGDDE